MIISIFFEGFKLENIHSNFLCREGGRGIIAKCGGRGGLNLVKTDNLEILPLLDTLATLTLAGIATASYYKDTHQ